MSLSMFYKKGEKDSKIKIVVVLFLLVFILFLVSVNAVRISQVTPVNSSVGFRIVNFTFNVNWTSGEITNCSLWTNISGNWEETRANDSSSNIVNFTEGNAISWINHTFSQDGFFVWGFGCYNSTLGGLNFSLNRSLTIDSSKPGVTLVAPSNSQTLVNNVSINWSITDGLSNISFVGYYIDDYALVELDFDVGGRSNPYVSNKSINLTGGIRTLKITANDTLGNMANSSSVSIVIVAPIPLYDWTSGLNITLGTEINSKPIFRVKDSNGEYNVQTGSELSNETFELILEVNTTGEHINVTITDLDGDTVNWAKINSTIIKTNNTRTYNGIQNNWTNSIMYMVFANDSLDDFATSSNGYYGTVTLPVNNSLVQEFWWFEDETDLETKINITECSGVFSASSSSPCWNYTSGGRAIVFVPHFSIVVGVNDSIAPTIDVAIPLGNQDVSEFVPKIIVSNDAVSCLYYLNGSSSVSMTLNGGVCTGSSIRLKNLAVVNGNYNLTFNVTDGNGNINSQAFKFNMSDNVAPNKPNSTTVSSSVGSTTASITISSINESSNATVLYGITTSTLNLSKSETDFASSQTVSLVSLTSSKKYYYNVSVCDYNGNCARNGIFTFTTDEVSSPSSSSSSSSSSGSSGGGAAAITTAVKVTSSAARIWSQVTAGDKLKLEIDKETIGVTSVSVTILNEKSKVELSVDSLESNPVEEVASKEVYQFLRIKKDFIQESETSGIVIKFRVPQTWLTTFGVAQSKVVLYRYVDDDWVKLPTYGDGGDFDYAYYYANTPGLSYFAIGAIDEDSTSEITNVDTGSDDDNEIKSGIILPPPEENKPETSKKRKWSLIGWGIAFVLILGEIFAYYEWRKNKGVITPLIKMIFIKINFSPLMKKLHNDKIAYYCNRFKAQVKYIIPERKRSELKKEDEDKSEEEKEVEEEPENISYESTEPSVTDTGGEEVKIELPHMDMKTGKIIKSKIKKRINSSVIKKYNKKIKLKKDIKKNKTKKNNSRSKKSNKKSR